jgi:hypothetical protein
VYEERKKSSVLYFFCSTAAEKESIEKIIVHIILHQIVYSLPPLKGGSFVTSFYRALVNAIPREKYSLNSELEITSWYTEEDLPDIAVSKALANLAPSYHWDALERIDPRVGGKQELSIIVDGLDEAERQTTGFIKKVYKFITHLQKRVSKVKVLFTSTSHSRADIAEILSKMSYTCIEYDKERKG